MARSCVRRRLLSFEDDTDSAALTATNPPSISQLMFISVGVGFSLCLSIWPWFRVSGGLFNPALAFALGVTGQLPPHRTALLIIAEFLGGMTGAGLAHALLPGGSHARTTVSPLLTTPQAFFLEFLLTAQLGEHKQSILLDPLILM